MILANGKVDIIWQVILVWLLWPVGNIIAFYRIKKLRKHLLHESLILLGVVGVIAMLLYMGIVWDLSWISPSIIVISLILVAVFSYVPFNIYSIIQIIRWSKKWNTQFEDGSSPPFIL